MDEGSGSDARRVWFGVEVVSVYEPLDEPVEEFVDEVYVRDWTVVERSVFLVSARDHDDARRIVEEQIAGGNPSVNVYGERVEHRVLESRVQSLGFAWPLRLADDGFAVEVYSDLWTTTRGVDPRALLGDPAPPDERTPLIDPIAFYEHRARYEELRGPLPGP